MFTIRRNPLPSTLTQRYMMLIWVGMLFVVISLPNVCSVDEFTCTAFAKKYTSCVCNEHTFTVTCRGNLGKDASVFENLPIGVQTVIVTGNNFTQLRVDLFGNCTAPNKQLKSLKKLDLSGNNITSIPGKTFHCIPNVEELILRDNEWRVDNNSNSVFSSMDKLEVLNLDNAFNDVLDCTTIGLLNCNTTEIVTILRYINITGMNKLISLNLARNEIWTIPEETQMQFGKMESLQKLNLSNNNIGDPRLKDPMLNLKELDLSSNRLPFLRMDFIKDLTKQVSLEHLYIQDNLYECDCWMKDFIDWLKNDPSSKVVNNSDDLQCFVGFGKIKEGMKIKQLDVNDLRCPSYDNIIYQYSPTIIAMSVLLVLVAAMFLFIVFLKREKIKTAWRRWSYSQSGLSHSTSRNQKYSSVKT